MKAKNAGKWKFSEHAVKLLDEAKQPLSIQQLQEEINRDFNNDFEATVDGLLNRTYRLGSKDLTAFQSDVALAYGLRNHGAHDVSTCPMICRRFPDVLQALFNTLFGTIDHLW